MPKLAIYVPKEAVPLIERWRRCVNFSQVFMRALREEIRRRETVTTGGHGGDVASAARHYWGLMEPRASVARQKGFQLGVRHVLECRLDPETIGQLVRLADTEGWQEGDFKLVARTMGEGMIQLDAEVRQVGCDPHLEAAWRRMACRGYVAGVADAWKRVCDEICNTPP